MALTNLGLFFLYFYYNINYQDHICPHPKNFTVGHTPVCTIYNGTACNNTVGFCQVQSSNNSIACAVKNVVSYYDGPCSKAPIHICSAAENVNKNCSTAYNPVCGLSYNKTFASVQDKDYQNGCQACSSGAGIYTVGPCDLEYNTTNGTDATGNPTTIMKLFEAYGVGGTSAAINKTNSTVTLTEYNDVSTRQAYLTVTIPKSGIWSVRVGKRSSSGSSSASQTNPVNTTKTNTTTTTPVKTTPIVTTPVKTNSTTTTPVKITPIVITPIKTNSTNTTTIVTHPILPTPLVTNSTQTIPVVTNSTQP